MNKRTVALTTEQYKEIIFLMKIVLLSKGALIAGEAVDRQGHSRLPTAHNKEIPFWKDFWSIRSACLEISSAYDLILSLRSPKS